MAALSVTVLSRERLRKATGKVFTKSPLSQDQSSLPHRQEVGPEPSHHDGSKTCRDVPLLHSAIPQDGLNFI